MDERLDASGGLADRGALVNGKLGPMQLRAVPQRVRQDWAGPRAGRAYLAELRFELAGAAGERGIDHAVDRQRRGVGGHRHDVIQLDARLAAREQRELADFMARRETIAAEQGKECGAGIRRNGKLKFPQLVIDETEQVSFRVGVARQRGGLFCALANGAQRRTALEIAGLDNDAAVRRGSGNERLQCGSKVARARFHPDCAAATEERNRVRLLDEARRLARELIAIEARELKRILRIVDRSTHQRFRALAHQARVGSKDQYDWPIGAGEESLDL